MQTLKTQIKVRGHTKRQARCTNTSPGTRQYEHKPVRAAAANAAQKARHAPPKENPWKV